MNVPPSSADVEARDRSPQGLVTARTSGSENDDSVAVLKSRGIPNAMGTIRLGASGRPFPSTKAASVSTGGSSERGVGGALATGSTNLGPSVAPSTDQKPHISLERHPSSPFGRRIELTKRLILVPEENQRERFQVKKTFSIRSHKRKLPGETKRPVSKVQASDLSVVTNEGESDRIATDAPSVHLDLKCDSEVGASAVLRTAFSSEHASHDKRRRVSPDAVQQNGESQRRAAHPPSIATSLDQTPSRSFASVGTAPNSITPDMKMDASTRADRKSTHHPAQHIHGGSIDFEQFTRRVQESDTLNSTKKGFHVAFHGQPASEYTRSTISEGSQAAASIDRRPDTTTKAVKTPWREVDESIDHIYADPSVDFVQLKLLHTSGEKDKRQKSLERKRVLTAATQLQEQKLERNRRHDELQRRKMQTEQLSDAIRQRNKRLLKKSDFSEDALAAVAQRRERVSNDDSGMVELERKPPVPRQRGRRRGHAHDRNSRLKEMTEAITSQTSQRDAIDAIAESERRRDPEGLSQPASVSSSILLGDSTELSTKDASQSIGEESREVGEFASLRDSVSAPDSDLDEPLARHVSARARSTRKKTAKNDQPEPNPVALQEKLERRELAREFMVLQKQRRHMQSAKQRQSVEMERERRRIQLETLEQERLASLRRAKKVKVKRRHVSRSNERDRSSIGKEFPRLSAEGMLGAARSEGDGNRRSGSEDVDDDNEYFSSDQENQANSRNVWNRKTRSSLSSDFGRRDDYDASLLVNYSSDNVDPSTDSTVPEIDARLRRLLELEEKTLKLSALVSGIQSRKTISPLSAFARTIVKLGESYVEEDGLSVPAPTLDVGPIDAGQHSVHEASEESMNRESGREDEESDSVSMDRHGIERSGEGRSGSEEGSAYEGEESESHAAIDVRREQRFGVEEVRPPADTFTDIERRTVEAAYLDSGVHDEFDPRSIGVHNIRVEWPMEHQYGEHEGGVVSANRLASPSSSSSSRSDARFAEEQPSPSNRGSLSSDRSDQMRDGGFEASIHSYMQQRLSPSSSSMKSSAKRTLVDDTSEHEGCAFDAQRGVAETVNDSSLHLAQSRAQPSANSALSKADETTQIEASEGFLQMIREADDSLSVINSAAKKIWLKQQQKLKVRIEQELQREQDAAQQEQAVKDKLLESVMNSLRVQNDEGGDTREREQSSGHVQPAESTFHHERLEDIMQEVEDEWMSEKQERDSNVNVHHQTQVNSPFQEADLKRPDSSASTFWNDMLVSSSHLKRNNPSLKVSPSMSRTAIDTSELALQRAQQQQLEDEHSESYKHEAKRVHSPKTLARLLLAEVEYHEAIHDAHVQLAMMEQAQVVEQAQGETINVANAFKEEMESNMASHQLAFEHAVLAQQFDGDLRDITHELESIRHTQSNEIAAAAAAMQAELRKASLRESTVQTDELKRTDAATSAKLYVESGTTTSPVASDAAVQYEPPDEEGIAHSITAMRHQSPAAHAVPAMGVSEARSTEMASSAELGYSEEEYEEDHFERESQSVVDRRSVSEVASSEALDEIPEGESGHEMDDSGAEIVSEDEKDGDDLTGEAKQSVASSTPYEDDEVSSENVEDEDKSGRSRAESIPSSEIGEADAVDDENDQSYTDDKQAPIASTSMDYDDDFEASSSHRQQQPLDQSGGGEDDIVDEDGEFIGSSAADEIDEDDAREDSDLKDSDAVALVGSEYLSEFREDTKDESKVAVGVPSIPQQSRRVEPQVARYSAYMPVTTSRIAEAEKPFLNRYANYHSDELAQAFQRDLEMRKQSDDSLLLLRLQVLEQRFQRDLQSVDEAIAATNGATPSHNLRAHQTSHELTLRKEALKMAFLSEKANVDSLKAASMARYYQDLLAFQSLMSGTTPSVNVVMATQMHQFVPATPRLDAPTQWPSQLFHTPADNQQSLQPEPTERESRTSTGKDDYGDEFESVSGEVEEHSNRDVSEDDVQSQQSIGSEKDDQGDVSEIEIEESAKAEVEGDGMESEVSEKYEEDDAYDEDFASISHSETRNAAQNSVADAGVEDDDLEERSIESDNASAAVSVVESDHISDKSGETGVDDEEAGADDGDIKEDGGEYEDEFASISGSDGTSVELTGKQRYSNDFEAAGEDDESSKVHVASKPLDADESMLVVEQSGSEDSSMTRLLIEQANTLHQETKEHSGVETKRIEEKMARKKIKAVELIQAKERLITQQKHIFKQEEEKRQVDALAQIALQMDVTTEVNRAKVDIKQQLESDMKTLRQAFPALLGTNSARPQEVAQVTETTSTQQVQQRRKFSPANTVLPENHPASEHPVESNVLEREIETEAAEEFVQEDEYEVDSFEQEQSVPDDDDIEDDRSVAEEEYGSFEDDESRVDESNRENGLESSTNGGIEDAGDDIASDAGGEGTSAQDSAASEVQSENDGIGDGIAFDVPTDGNELEGDIEDDEESGVGYEDAYEDDFFDDAQVEGESEHEQMKPKQPGQREEASDQEGLDASDESEYSDESFENGSASSSVVSSSHLPGEELPKTAARKYDDMATEARKNDAPIEQGEQQQIHVSIDDLSPALDAVASQLYPPEVDDVSVDTGVKDLLTAPQPLLVADDSQMSPNVSVTHLSVSVSHEEEVLSKSIEEQTKRLEELKRMILNRKDEILSVQKHMRIEKRKEQLRAEEKRLWDEMERVEADLRTDEATLELTRQRNRLESIRLEAKHQEHKVRTVGDLDLLEGFAYIERAEKPSVGTERIVQDGATTKKTVWGATSDMVCQTDGTIGGIDESVDLLRGYAYVEDAEAIEQPSTTESTARTASSEVCELESRLPSPTLEESGNAANKGWSTSNSAAPAESSAITMDNNEITGSGYAQVDTAVDLLDGYPHIEDAEQVVDSDEDLLAVFDYVEDAERLRPGDGSDLRDSVRPSVREEGSLPAPDEIEGYSDEADALSNDGDGSESQLFVMDEDELADGQYPRSSDEAFASDVESAHVPTEDPSLEAQVGLQHRRNKEEAGSEGESDVQNVEEHGDIGYDCPDELVDCVAATIYAEMFASMMEDTSKLFSRLGPRAKLTETREVRETQSQVDDASVDDSVESGEDMREDGEGGKGAFEEQHSVHENSLDERSVRMARAMSESITESADIDSKSEKKRSEQIVERLFDDLYDSVVASEIQVFRKRRQSQIGSKKPHPHKSESDPSESAAPEVVDVSHADTNPLRETVVCAERDFVSKVIRQLGMQAGRIRLPAHADIQRRASPELRSSRQLYEAIQEIAESIVSNLRASAHCAGDLLDTESDLRIDIVDVRQQVEIEMERVLSIRAAGKGELARQTQDVLEDMDSSDATREDQQVMQTQFRTNVIDVADRIRQNVVVSSSSDGAPAAYSGSTPRNSGAIPPRSFYPRTPTPTSRPTSRRPMLLNALFTQESAQLQERISNFILDDLLAPDQLALHR